MGETLQAGSVLAGKYRLVAPLGSGGMGTVWRADHLVLHCPVAVKVLNERAAQSAHGPTRFLREAQAAAALRSPNVVQILDVGVEGSVPFIVMEMLEGESLAARLKRVGRLDLASTQQIVTETARALHKAHEAGIVHRDLKPDNIFLVRDVDREIVKVLDFGIAKLVEQIEVEQLTGTGSVLGTPHYMSPEQARGRREVDHRTDLWALGVIAYECSTGRRPYDSHALGDLLMQICTESAPPPSSAGGLPSALDAFMARALARDPAQRFSSALEMADAFANVAGSGSQRSAVSPQAPFGAPVAASSGSGGAPGAMLGTGWQSGYGVGGSGAGSSVEVSSSMAPSSHGYEGRQSAPASGFAAEDAGSTGKGMRWLLLAVGAVFAAAFAVVGIAVAFVLYSSESEPTASSRVPASSAPTVTPSDAGMSAPGSDAASVDPVSPKTSPKSAGAPKSSPVPVAAPAPAVATTAKKPASSACDTACAKIAACGAGPCPAGDCVGVKLSAAHCINSKKNCVDMASCF